MTKRPRSDPHLDTVAQDLLSAYRHEEQLPKAVQDRVWERLSTAPAPAAPPWWRRHAIITTIIATTAAASLMWLVQPSVRSSLDRAPTYDHAILEHTEQPPAESISVKPTPSSSITDLRMPSLERLQQHPPASTTQEPKPSPASESTSASPPEPASATQEPKPSHAIPEPTSASATQEPDPSPDPVTPSATQEPSPSHASESTSDSTSASRDASTLRAELDLIERARRALDDARISDARAALELHHQRFPTGVLTAERNGLILVEQCLRNAASDSRVRSFLASHDRSPVAIRVKQACKPRSNNPSHSTTDE